MNTQLHKAQLSLLYTLRHAPNARFSELMRPTGMQSDDFKFHVRKLVQAGYVEKTGTGLYALTPRGKEFANNLDDTNRATQRQPKLSVVVVASRLGDDGERQYLFQQRRRSPFFGFWGCISGPVQWGEGMEEAAARELQKQTGLVATCRVRAFRRVRDYDESKQLLEDKLFAIVEATELRGELSDSWHGGSSQWMTLDDLKQQPRYFTLTTEIVDMLEAGETYQSGDMTYSSDEY